MQVEGHSIGFIPEAERYGHPRRLFTIWTCANLQILGLGVGALGTWGGLSLLWTLIALVIGNTVGTFFMAAHSAQGPQLGVPQMIQSRAQFGVIGAALPMLSVVVSYTLYSALDAIIASEPITTLIPVSQNAAIVLFTVVALIVAFIGYELIHRLGAVLAIANGLVFIGATLILMRRVEWPAALIGQSVNNGFVLTAFLISVAQSTSWCLSASPYVADYSRYLAADVSAKATFWYTALGNFLGATLIMALGAFLGAHFAAIAHAPGNGIPALFGSLGSVVKILIILGVFFGVVMNAYSAYMSLTTVLTGPMKRATISQGMKFATMAAITIAASLIAIATKDQFDVYFGDVLAIVIYTLIPWSAINLADYYLVRHGRYDTASLFDANGIYGAFNWTAITVYLIAIGVQIPFARLSFYVGPIAAFTGADFAWVPGLIIPAVMFTILERRNLASARQQRTE